MNEQQQVQARARFDNMMHELLRVNLAGHPSPQWIFKLRVFAEDMLKEAVNPYVEAERLRAEIKGLHERIEALESAATVSQDAARFEQTLRETALPKPLGHLVSNVV